MLTFLSAQIPSNAILNQELQQLYNALRSKLILLAACTVGVICWREYTLTVDAIKKQLLSIIKVSLDLDGWTSTNILAITLVIGYHIV